MKKLNKSRVLRGMTKIVLLELEKKGEDTPTLDDVAALLQSMVDGEFSVRSDFLRNALSTKSSPFIVRADGTVTWRNRGWKKRR